MRGMIEIAGIVSAGVVGTVTVTVIVIAEIGMIGIIVRADAETVMRGMAVEDLYMTGRVRLEPIIVSPIDAAQTIGATPIRETMIAVTGPIIPTTETGEIIGVPEIRTPETAPVTLVL
jgi:hypothetical protein